MFFVVSIHIGNANVDHDVASVTHVDVLVHRSILKKIESIAIGDVHLGPDIELSKERRHDLGQVETAFAKAVRFQGNPFHQVGETIWEVCRKVVVSNRCVFGPQRWFRPRRLFWPCLR